MSYRGIDVSYCNGCVDWVKAKAAGLQFAILQLGYGSNSTSQDDVQCQRNVRECERLGIPWGAYLYSYASNSDKLQSEINHALRLLRYHHPQYPVFFDAEDAGTLGGLSRQTITDFIKHFCDVMVQSGYKAGYYCNGNWYRNKMYPNQLKKYEFWYAYPDTASPNIHCDIWQNAFGECTGRWPGANIPGKGCDTNVCYKNYTKESTLRTLPALAPAGTAFTSDTTTTVGIKRGQSYTLRVTCPAGRPNVTAGKGSIADITYQSRSGSKYYFKITATGKVGTATGIYINGHKPSTMIARVTTACESDTTINLSRKVGECYAVGLTSPTKPSVTAGTGNVATIAGVFSNGSGKWLCPIVAVRPGVTGIYTEVPGEGSPVKRFEFKVV